MKVAIIGLGLIGGSMGRALIKKTGAIVYANDISPDVLLKGELLGCYNERLTDENITDVDLLVIGVYPRAFSECAEKWLPKLKAGATVMDVCGNKRMVVGAMRELSEKYPSLNFIATHPMAGREFSGVEHSTASLFENCFWIICPVVADIESISALKRALSAIGARKIIHAEADFHDEIIAYTSQLCHVVSSAFVKSESAEKLTGFTAGSFRDLTRVAKLNPDMWAELFLENSDNLVPEIQNIINNLGDYLAAIESGDRERLITLLQDGADRKSAVEKTYQRFIRDDENRG